jgi:hypothetical protein
LDRSTTLNPRLLELLIEERVLDAASASALESRVRDGWIPLGSILRQQGKMTMAQLVDILGRQAEAPQIRVGEFAVEGQVCSREDVDEALRIQLETSVHALDLLLRDESCNLRGLCTALARYVRELEAGL